MEAGAQPHKKPQIYEATLEMDRSWRWTLISATEAGWGAGKDPRGAAAVQQRNQARKTRISARDQLRDRLLRWAIMLDTKEGTKLERK